MTQLAGRSRQDIVLLQHVLRTRVADYGWRLGEGAPHQAVCKSAMDRPRGRVLQVVAVRVVYFTPVCTYVPAKEVTVPPRTVASAKLRYCLKSTNISVGGWRASKNTCMFST